MCQAPTMKTNSMSTAMVWLIRHIKYNICLVIFEKSACMVFPIKLRCVIVSIICFLVFFLSQFLWREINHSIVPFLQRTSTYTKKGVVKINMRPVLGMISNCYGKQLRRECRSILVHSEAMWYKSKCCLWFLYGMKTSANLFIR